MKIVSKALSGFALFFVLIAAGYFLGPQVEKPNMDTSLPKVSNDLEELEQWINDREKAITNIKPNNEGRIVWFDSVPTKTNYSIVYLHGWSASQMEGHPLHMDIARKFGCNLYLPRLAGHGLDEQEPMLDLTADGLLESAKEAIAVGKRLGNKVIVMATSTGGTLALHLAGGDKDIAALILYSPNIEIYDPNAKLLAGPWGLQLARMVKQSDYHEFEGSEEKQKYWTTKYRVEALTQLQALVENTMNKEAFQKVDQPVFMGYFYRNDSIQDNVVSVPAMLTMYQALGTPESKKRKKAFPDAGDHVIASEITSKDLEAVRWETEDFLEDILLLRPAE